MKSNVYKRFSVILLSVMVMISMMPVGAFAEIEPGSAPEETQAADIGGSTDIQEDTAESDVPADVQEESPETQEEAAEPGAEEASEDEQSAEASEEEPVDAELATEEAMEADAAKEPVTYLDENGKKQTLTDYVDLATVPIQGGGDLRQEYGNWYVLTKGTFTVSGRINILGNINLLVCDGAELDANAGIHVGDGNELRIYGQSASSYNEDQDKKSMGRIVASAADGSENAGIGSNDEESGSGRIYIYGGRVEAKGAKYAAGIGGGDQSHAYVEIHGGSISAEGGEYGAGIGGGDEAEKEATIYIYNGFVRAFGGYDAAGIGSGNEGAAPAIVIEDGEVDAHGGRYGAGIGGGDDSNGGTIEIKGGKVTGTSGPISTNILASGVAGAGIGGGRHGNAGSIIITGGDVHAYGRKMAAGIGSGGDNDSMAYTGSDSEGCKGGVIRISGGKVLATGKDEAGGSGDCRVTNDGGAGIGSGAESFGCLVIIQGGQVEAVASGHGKRTLGHAAWAQEFSADFGAAIGNGYAAESQGIVHLIGDGDQGPAIHVETTIGHPASGAEFGWTYDRVAAIGAAPDSNNCTVDISTDWHYEVRTALWDDYTTRLRGKQKNVEPEKRMAAITGQADTWIDTCEHAKTTWNKSEADGHTFECQYCGYVSEKEEHKYTGTWSIEPLKHYHTCTVCGYREEEQHKYSEDEHKCTVCGKEIYVVKFVPGEASGDEAGEFASNNESFQFKDASENYKFKHPAGLKFIGWKKTSEGGEPVESTKIYKAGDYGYIFADTTFTAVWGDSWNNFCQSVTSASSYGSTVRLAGDVYRSAKDGPVIVSKGNVTVDLSGHTVDIGKITDAEYGEGFLLLGGKLTIIDSSPDKSGRITGGFGKEGHGGAVTIMDGATLVLEGGIITGNKAHYGGGVLVEKGGTLELKDGTITGNIGTFDCTGSGIYAKSGATINVSGSPVVRDNGYSSLLSKEISNACLEDGVAFTVTGTLQPDAFIGFDLAKEPDEPVLVVKNLKGNGSKDSFGSDDRYSTSLYDDGNLYAGKGNAVVRFVDEKGEEITESMNVLTGANIYLPTCSAVPAADKTFAGWNDGEKTYQALEQVKISGNKTFTCTWKSKRSSEVNITVRPGGGIWDWGSAFGDKDTIDKEDTDDWLVNIIARPRRGNKFKRWVIYDWGSSNSTNSTKKNALLAAPAPVDAADVTSQYLEDPTSEFASFTVKDTDLVVEAEFEQITQEGVTLSEESLDMTAGDTYQLSATVLPAGSDQAVKWTSEDPEIAAVDDNGVVTAKKEGLASVRATAGEGDNARSAVCYVSVGAKCTVTFDSDGGSEVGSVDVGAKGTIEKPDDPVKDGFKFVAWRQVMEDGSLADEDFDFTLEIVENITLKAIWQHDHSAGNLDHHEFSLGTCTEDGNAEYWYCKDCDKYYADAEGTKEYSKDAWVIKADHRWKPWRQYDEKQHRRVCANDSSHTQFEDHQWDGGVEESDGTMTYTCMVCGFVKTGIKEADDAAAAAADKKAEAEALTEKAKSSVAQAEKTAKAGSTGAAAEKVVTGAQNVVKAAEKAVDEAVKAAEEAYKAAEEAYGKDAPEVQKAAENLENTRTFAANLKETLNTLKTAADNAAKTVKANTAAKKKYTPAKVKISKAKRGKKKVSVRWRTIKKGVTGYQVSIVSKKTGKAVRTVKYKQTKKLAKKKYITKTIKKLKKGKYKVRVRAYRTVGGKTYYGTWSKYKSFKVK